MSFPSPPTCHTERCRRYGRPMRRAVAPGCWVCDACFSGAEDFRPAPAVALVLLAMVGVFLALPAPSLAQAGSCSAVVTFREGACPAGTAAVCETKGDTLTWSEVEGTLGDVAELCIDSAGWLTLGGDLCGTISAPTVCADAVALGTDTTGGYAGSASEGGPAASALALASDPAACSAGLFGVDTTSAGALVCEAIEAGDLPGTLTSSTSGNAATASALAANGANCSAGQAPLGGDAAGAAEGCHSGFALLAGRPGGQTLAGGTGAGELLVLDGSATTAGSLSVTDAGALMLSGAEATPWYLTNSASGFLVGKFVFNRFAFDGSNAGFAVTSGGYLGITSDSFDPAIVPDTRLTRDAAGVFKVRDLYELTPLASPPTCEAGRVYYDSSDALCACAAGTWYNLTPLAGGACA